jgi:hypothetical protein
VNRASCQCGGAGGALEPEPDRGSARLWFWPHAVFLFLIPIPGAAEPRGQPVVWGIAAVLLMLHGILVWRVQFPRSTGNGNAVYLLLARAIHPGAT